jgi:pimeloyl-ACP methyl ester carboxylesterase
VSVALPGLVLVHGGGHSADCWDLTVAELRRRAPTLRVLAVDLPGHGDKPGDLETVTATDRVDSVVADIDAAGLETVVVVGHSMAGLTVPGVVGKLGSSRVREMVLAAAFVPPQGSSIADTLSGPLARYTRRAARIGAPPAVMSKTLARWTFCNGMTPGQRRFALSRLRPESVRMAVEIADRSALPDDIARTWILTTKDWALSQRSQRASIAALGGVESVIAVDTCHEVMISQPVRLAEILVERCQRWATPAD